MARAATRATCACCGRSRRWDCPTRSSAWTIPNHDLDSPAYRALNPFGQIPVIDDDGVVVSESGAILLYLARKSGKLMPRDLAGEAQVLRWSLRRADHDRGAGAVAVVRRLERRQGHKPSEALHDWADMRLKQLDGWLADRQFIATDDFTVADILMTHVLDAGTPIRRC